MLSPSIGVCWTSVVLEGTMISTRKICRHRQLQLQVPGEAWEGALSPVHATKGTCKYSTS